MSDPEVPAGAQLNEIAYLNEPYWFHDESGWIKNLLLFFPAVGVLVPDYMRDRPLISDPELAQPLDDLGLLRRLSPERLVDKTAAENLAENLVALLEARSFEDDEERVFASLSYSRLGGFGDQLMADYLIEALRERGLAKDSLDGGYSIPVDIQFRGLILGILPQLIKTSAEADGLSLQPVTERPQLMRALEEVLELREMPTAGQVIAADLVQVSADLSIVPLDEVLSFREAHGNEYQQYARNLRTFLRALAAVDAADRRRAIADRQAELAEEAKRLRAASQSAWKQPATFLLGIAGAAVSILTGGPAGVAGGGIGLAATVLGTNRASDPGGAYTYIFRAQRELQHN